MLGEGRTLQLYKYRLCPSKAEVRTKLSRMVVQPRQEKDKQHFDEKITLETKFHKYVEHTTWIGGKIEHEIQQKLPHTDNEYIRWFPIFYFFIVPQLELLILHGPTTGRNEVITQIEKLLSGDSQSIIEVIRLKKEKMDVFEKSIRDEALRNRIHIQKNKHDRKGDNQGIEDFIIKMHKGSCASNIDLLQKEKKKATSYDLKFGIVKCAGIIDEEISDEIKLTLTSKAEISLSRDLDIEKWNTFVIQRCKALLD